MNKKLIAILTFVVIMVLMMNPANVEASMRIAKETNRYDHTIAYTGCTNQWIHVEATSSCIISMYDRYGNCVWSSDWSNRNLYKCWGQNYAYQETYWCGSDVYRIVARTSGGGPAATMVWLNW